MAYAYRIPGETVRPDGIATHPLAKRLAPAGPWQCCDSHDGGTLLTFKGASVSLDSYGPPQVCDDGLVYYPSLVPLTPADLGKANIPDSVPVTLASGMTLSIPVARRSARKRSFTGKAVGDYVSEFPRLAFSVYDRVQSDQAIKLDDRDLVRVIFLAVSLCYRVTEEVLSDLGWLSTADDDPIISAVFGLDPKAVAAAGSI